MSDNKEKGGVGENGDKTDLKAIYKGFWKCRDLEIQMLWTRLTMLGTFMVLTYTGYGFLLMKLGGQMPSWNVFNLLAVGMGCFGMTGSTLWILMAKGSKGWFERYEAAIKHFQKENGEFFAVGEKEGLVRSYLDFGNPKIEAERAPVDSSLFTQRAGRFSVSKIPIVMGQVSLVGWVGVTAGHVWCLMAGERWARAVVGHLGAEIAVAAVVATVFAISVICLKSRSGSL